MHIRYLVITREAQSLMVTELDFWFCQEHAARAVRCRWQTAGVASAEGMMSAAP